MINRKRIEGVAMLALAVICFWLPQHMQAPGAADLKIMVAKDSLKGGPFDHAVVLVVQHNGYGATGFVLNREAARGGVSSGGPVAPDHFYTLHSLDVSAEGTHRMTNIQAAWTEGEAFARSFGGGKKPDEYIILKGHAGWSAAQLEREIKSGAWKIIPYDENLVFHTPPAKMYEMAAAATPVSEIKEEKEEGPVF